MSLFLALFGVIVFSLGGLSAAKFWEGLSNTSRRKSLKYLFSIALPLLLFGAFLSTYYWNKYFYDSANEKSRVSIIHILAAETLINLRVSQDRKFNEPVDSNLSTFVIYPRFQMTALQASLPSGLFNEDKDIDLFTLIFELNENLNDANNRLDLTEKQMLINSRPDNIKTWRLKVRDGNLLNSLNSKLKRLAELLIEKYGIEYDDTFFNKEDKKTLPDSS